MELRSDYWSASSLTSSYNVETDDDVDTILHRCGIAGLPERRVPKERYLCLSLLILLKSQPTLIASIHIVNDWLSGEVESASAAQSQ